MEPTPTEPQSNHDGRNDLQKVIHSFVFGGEAPSTETESRATFLKSFLAEYYNTALKGTDYSVSSPESGYAHSCNNTSTCNINSPCNASTTTNEVNACNNTGDDKDSAATTRALTTEHPNIFNSLNSADEAERLNSMRDMASKLAVKLSGVCKELTKGTATISASNLVKSVLKLSNPTQSDSQNKEVGDLSQHLQLFVDNINESLHMLGTTDLTEEELKLLLAAAPLPTIGNADITVESEPATRPRSLSAGEILARTASPRNLVSRRLKHSVSEGVRHVTREAKPLTITSTINEESTGSSTPNNDDESPNKRPFLSISGGLNKSGEVVVTRPRSLSLETDTVLNLSGEQDSAEGTPTGTPGKSKRRLSSFFTKKMESFTNLLDNIEFAERDDTPRTFSKSKSFNLGPRSGTSTPNKSGCVTPRSGYATPHEVSQESEDLDVAALKSKLEQVEKALCDEVVVRAAAEQKATQACDLVCRLKTDLDRVQSQKETVAVINKQMSVELRFLRQRNSKTTRDRQQWEDALVGETKKRRALEEQMQMLIKSYQERNVNSTPSEGGELTNKQQEEVFSKQREEVLLAVIESIREQLHAADNEMERARNEWQEERAKYQETHDLLRFQLDQLTLTRQQATGKDTELGEEADEIVKNRDVPMSRQLRHQVSVHDLREQQDNVETKKESEKPVTERMKLFFLSPSWWPKFDFINNSSAPARPPVLLMQIAWWVSELREYATTHQDAMKALVSGHSMNQFCACSDCVKVGV